MQPLAIDLYCGLGGWTEGLLAEGYRVVGFDNERHKYGEAKYPGQLVIQDVLTLHGSQFKDAALIVASPPCQEYSYMAMPWSRAKAIAADYRSGARDTKNLTALFDACFRIQREAIEAAGHFIPLVVENVRGAQPWVGRASWHFGSFYLWGDVPALMPIIKPAAKVPMPAGGDSLTIGFQQMAKLQAAEGFKSSGMNWSDQTKRGQDFTRIAGKQSEGQKTAGLINKRNGHGLTRHLTNQSEHDAVKVGGDWFGSYAEQKAAGTISPGRMHGKGSKARKAASAAIAKIPFVLAQHIARVYKP
jgi:hypothetical protein